MDRAVLLERIAADLRHQQETVKAKEFLEQVVQISELLVEREPDEFEFAHLSLQEYLAAAQLVEQKQESLLYEHFEEDWWKTTILLYAALTNPTALIEKAVRRGAIDLAFSCLQQTTKKINAELKQTIKTLRWVKLEEMLKAQQWKDADLETYRLMITAVGKDHGQYFTRSELLNFPCDELRAIDGLWVKYSNGHFGFSVQKQIYVECGGQLDGNDSSLEVWMEFCDRVGWINNGEWINYSSLYPSLSSLQGIFPAALGRLMVLGELGWMGCLFLLSHKDL